MREEVLVQTQAGGTYVTILLYNTECKVRSEEDGMMTFGERDPALIHDWPLNRQEIVPAAFHLEEYENLTMKLKIEQNEKLPGGELIIESPLWLRNKVFRLKMKRNINYKKGIDLAIKAPTENSKLRVEYEPPTKEKRAYIGLSVYKHNDDPEVVSAILGPSTTSPNIHCFPMGEPFSTLNLYAVRELTLRPEIIWPDLFRPSVIVWNDSSEMEALNQNSSASEMRTTNENSSLQEEAEKEPDVSIQLYGTNWEASDAIEIRCYEQNDEMQLLKHIRRRIIRKFEYKCDIINAERTKTAITMTIGPNAALSGGEIILTSEWLTHNQFMFRLPKDDKLNNGLIVTVFNPMKTNKKRADYYKPAEGKLAKLFVTTCSASASEKSQLPAGSSANLNEVQQEEILASEKVPTPRKRGVKGPKSRVEKIKKLKEQLEQIDKAIRKKRGN